MAVAAPGVAAAAPSGARRAAILAGLAVVLLAALALRLPDLGRSLWIDELITDWVTSAGAAELAARSWIANLSPAFFFVPWLSRSLLGASELALRLPSLAAGLLLILALWACLRELGVAPWAALACCGLAALDPDALEWAVTARPPALVAFGALLHTLAFLRLIDGSRASGRDWIAWVVFHVFCFYMHYTSLLALTGQGVCVLLASARRPQLLTPFAIAASAIALLCLPALPHLHYLFTHRGTLGYVPTEELSNLFGVLHLDRYVLVPLLVAGFLPELWARDQGRWFEPSAFAAKRESLRCLVLLYAVPILLVWGLAKLGIVQLSLYRSYCWALPLLMLGLLATLLVRRERRALMVGTALLLMATSHESPLVHLARDGNSGSPHVDWRGALAHVRERAAPGDAVLVDAGLVEGRWLTPDASPLLRGYLLSPVGGLYALDATRLHVAPISLGLAWLDPEAVAVLAAGGSSWLVAPTGHRELIAGLGSRLERAGVPVRVEGPLDLGGVSVARLFRGSGERR